MHLTVAGQRHVFYELMRPEFVRNWPREPLCSDAFTRWLHADPRAAEHNAAVVRASRVLFQKTIPAFALELVELLVPVAASDEREYVALVTRQLDDMLNKLVRKVSLTVATFEQLT